ncbi:SDR family oxidoreductase [Defluviimonas sp. D31]|uniref:SDR family NAD(P)-dependent oxidoreductase n=1 Tax=Defluviimonas sp. D31 TaxID=3083253 RepID=UPI0029700041|nr:SDR family NAD(P)-dependent oxidoreductase [Defluviimonas sp. D31]MDW4550405.1 SDR family oxidoreductase [Defluviimonas sp. D31]
MRRAALVTGAADGVGQETARLMAKAGWDIAVHYHRNRAGAEATARAVAEAGGRAEVLQADLSEPMAPQGLMAACGAAFPRLDALVNNAGITDAAARVEEITPARLTRMFAVNLTAPFLLAGLAARRMSTRHGGEGGVIVNVSSVAARLGAAGRYVDYASAKAGLDILTKGLAEEVAAEGIRVVSIRPGTVGTGTPAETVQVDRPGRPDEIAKAIVWLSSDEASCVTGTVLDINGGR